MPSQPKCTVRQARLLSSSRYVLSKLSMVGPDRVHDTLRKKETVITGIFVSVLYDTSLEILEI